MTAVQPSAIIVEDHPLVSEIVEDILTTIIPGMAIFRAGDCREIATVVGSKEIEIGVFDVSLPGGNVFAAIRSCKERRRQFRAVILTGNSDQFVVSQGMQSGVAAIISKNNPRDVIYSHIKTALSASHMVLCPFFSHLANAQPDFVPAGGAVTNREKEILDLTLKGLPIKNISEALGISPLTVKKHRQRILAKCGARNTRELIAQSRTP